MTLQITFRDIRPSAPIEAAARKRATALKRYFDKITFCRVVVSEPHRHHHKGRLYQVNMEVRIPGSDVIISREHRGIQAHEDVFVALRDAFRAARRALEDQTRRLRGEVKKHLGPPGVLRP